jgi:Cu2+-exporting ATPase
MIDELGFKPHLMTAEAVEQCAQQERRSLLKRLAVAGLGMMQVMMFAIALYAGDFQGMEANIRDYLRIISLIVTTPVLVYAGAPFFRNAYHALRARSISMDVPVSLGLMLAFTASLINTWRHVGEVYFDSVVMFIFFLTVARYVEMIARHTNTSVTDSLSRLLPVIAHRVMGERHEDVAVAELNVGDLLLVRVGEIVPADAVVYEGETRLDEAMLTGEPMPVRRGVGQRVVAGTLNLDAPVVVKVTAVGATTILSGIVALLNRAQADRPAVTRAADRTASHFLWRVVIVAAIVGTAWSFVDPTRALPAMLAVLVVACPCALSLATLVVVSSATTALARRGVLVTNADAIEALAKVSHVVFDKTGTLTNGRLRITDCRPSSGWSTAGCMDIAAALEIHSEHPIARAFATDHELVPTATELQVMPGNGIEGVVNGVRYRLGTPKFVGELTAQTQTIEYGMNIVLGDRHGQIGAFCVGDTLRPEAPIVVSILKRLGLGTELLSGDVAYAVARVAADCTIDTCSARQSPQDKLERIRKLTRAGEFVAMVGDGINDAPGLSGASVSIAMSHGSPLAIASADLILLNDSLDRLPEVFTLAKRARVIMKQNLAWAAAYNLSAMPLAALGLIPPWLAAIGMSLSSIMVVLNALRIIRTPVTAPAMADARASTALPHDMGAVAS